MLTLSVIGIFCAGILTGFCIRKTKIGKTDVVISAEAFQYFIERDEELWRIEKNERSELQFVTPSLVEDCRNLVKEKSPSLLN